MAERMNQPLTTSDLAEWLSDDQPGPGEHPLSSLTLAQARQIGKEVGSLIQRLEANNTDTIWSDSPLPNHPSIRITIAVAVGRAGEILFDVLQEAKRRFQRPVDSSKPGERT